MKKKLAILAATASFLAMAVPVLAKKGPTGPAGKSGMSHLYLHEKDQTDWSIMEDGAWGKITYGDEFVFNGHGLDPEVEYTLVRYTDPWPGTPVCLGSDVANNGGNVHVAGEMLDGGPKVWLILADDLDCETGVWSAWTPAEYLFEYNVI